MGAAFEAVLDAASASWRTAFHSAVEAAPSPEQALGSFERLAESAGSDTLLAWPEEQLGDLAIILGGSTYFARLLFSRGADWVDLAARYRQPPPSRDVLLAECCPADDADVATLHRTLRRAAAA